MPTVIDDFEDGDAAEYTSYDLASGSGISTDHAFEGSNSLEVRSNATGGVFAAGRYLSTSGLAAYPSDQDIFRVRLHYDSNGAVPVLFFGVQDESTAAIEGYAFEVNNVGTAYLKRLDGPTETTLDSSGSAIFAGSGFTEITVDLTPSSGFEVRYTGDNGEATLSTTDETYVGTSMGIGFGVWAQVDTVYSAWWDAAEFIEGLVAPSGLSATVVDETQIDLAWTDNAAAADEHRVYRAETSGSTVGDYTQIATVGGDAESYADTSAFAEGERYYYRVTAYDSDLGEETAVSNEVSALPVALPAPSNLGVDGVSGDQISVSWTDNAADEDGYRVSVSDDAGQTWTNDSGDLAPDTTSYTTTNLLDGEQYRIKVEAFTADASAVDIAVVSAPYSVSPTETVYSKLVIQR